MLEKLQKYAQNNSSLLFNHAENNPLLALFNNKGFTLSLPAQEAYNKIKNEPHLYVAWADGDNGHYYIGKSFQQGGRWKRQHSYHLGTLAHHLLKTTRSYDQNHARWIAQWMRPETLQVDKEPYTIELKQKVNISFIPFHGYSSLAYHQLSNKQIKDINDEMEQALIAFYQKANMNILNIFYAL
jgi:hypothetical protein